jgi:hypothetical protein
VVEHDAGVGEIPREACSFVKLAPRRLQLEVQSERREVRVARAPLCVFHHAGFRLVTDAAHKIVLRMGFKHCGAVLAMKPGLPDRNGREAGRISNFL